MLGEGQHALNVRGINARFGHARLSRHGRETTPALHMTSCEVQERSIWPETTSGASIVTNVLDSEEGRGLRLPHRL